MNSCFNNREYAGMREIYRPDGRILSEPEWQAFTKGLVTWLNTSGKILESTIISSNVSDSGGIFQIQTVYERMGQQSEQLVVKKVNGSFFITSLE